MKIKTGKFYYRRDWEIAGPAFPIADRIFPFMVGGSKYTEEGFYFAPDINGYQPKDKMDLIKVLEL